MASWTFRRRVFTIAALGIGKAYMEIIITRRRTKRQGLAFDLDYRWRGQRYRPLLGYDLTPAEAQQRAIEMIQKIQATAPQHAQTARQAPTVRDLLPLFWEIFQVKKRLDRTRPVSWKTTSSHVTAAPNSAPPVNTDSGIGPFLH